MTTQEPKDVASRRHVVFSPVEWGQDELTGFLIAAEKNAMARFANRNDDFSLLVEVDKLFRLVVQNIDNTEEWFEAFFLLRSHSAFLATVRLAVSGQASESYATSRQCIEFALYGFYLFRHKNLQELWLSRTESKGHRQKVRDTFNCCAYKSSVDLSKRFCS